MNGTENSGPPAPDRPEPKPEAAPTPASSACSRQPRPSPWRAALRRGTKMDAPAAPGDAAAPLVQPRAEDAGEHEGGERSGGCLVDAQSAVQGEKRDHQHAAD